ncbi:MAG TPA: polysaccharide deacetylase family protein [Prolixibacteraceae bacterium]|nr:polysaccharide deacetylase family protein [Prolixibacteraceae bacterium]
MGKNINFRVHLPGWLTKLFPQAIWLLPSGEKTLYLSFDDGPVPEVTSWVLDILHEKNIKATFFCVGDNVRKYPELFERMKREGHSVGNHTHNHLQGIKCMKTTYLNNIEEANNYIASDLFRPPHGIMTQSQYKAIIQKYKLVMWDVISCDYDPSLSPEKCIKNVIDFVRDGSIITFHDSVKAKKNIMQALPTVIDTLTKQGYQFKKIEFTDGAPLIKLSTLKEDQSIQTNINKLLRGAS